MKMHEPKKSFTGKIKTLVRGLSALDEISRRKDGVTQSELSRNLGVDRSTALRFLNTFEGEGYVHRSGGRYYATMKIAAMARNVLEGMEVRRYAAPKLRALTAETGFSSHLAVLSGLQVVYIYGEEGTGMVKVNAEVGMNAPVHCTATGKALVAFQDKDSRELLVERQIEESGSLAIYTEKSIRDIESLEEHYEIIRQKGYAVDNEEFEPGIRCLAAPVFDAGGGATAVIGISGTTSRLSWDRVEDFARTVCVSAESISEMLGFKVLSPYKS